MRKHELIKRITEQAEISKIKADEVLNAMTSGISEALANGESTIRALDGMIASLQEIRESVVADNKETLDAVLDRAEEGRAVWLGERRSADWLLGEEKSKTPIEIAGVAERFFGFRQKKPRD